MDPQVQLPHDFLVVQLVLVSLLDQLDQSNRVVQIVLDHLYHPLFQEILDYQLVQEILQVLMDPEVQVDLEAQMDLENQYHLVVQVGQEYQFLRLIQDHQLHLVAQLVLLHRWDLKVLEDQESLVVQIVPVDRAVHYHRDFQVFQVILVFLVALHLLGNRLVQLDQEHQMYPADPELLGYHSVQCRLLDLSDPPDLKVPLVHLHLAVLWDQTVLASRQNLAKKMKSVRIFH